jgi:outer membrane immunogenic protein
MSFLAGIAVFAIGVAGPAAAADQNWTGFYAGGNLGYGWGNADASVLGLPVSPPVFAQSLSAQSTGMLGGLQGGYNWQFSGKWLLGAELDFQGADISGGALDSPILLGTPLVGAYVQSHTKLDWFSTLRARIGFLPMDRLLLYVTGGAAYGSTSNTGNLINPGVIAYPAKTSDSRVGWAAGAGAEWALPGMWTVKAEYLYLDLGSNSAVGFPTPLPVPFAISYQWKGSANMLRLGVNYKF